MKYLHRILMDIFLNIKNSNDSFVLILIFAQISSLFACDFYIFSHSDILTFLQATLYGRR
jgi:hypothetical protein